MSISTAHAIYRFLILSAALSILLIPAWRPMDERLAAAGNLSTLLYIFPRWWYLEARSNG